MTVNEESNKLKVLMIEDNPMDTRYIYELLKDTKLAEIELTDTDRVSRGLEMMSTENFDVLLLDLSLPDATNLEALEKIITYTNELPIVVLTGKVDEEQAITAVQRGAQDYLLKGHFDKDLLIRAILYSIERNKIKRELKKSEEKYKSLFEGMPIGLYSTTPDGVFIAANPIFLDMVGYSSLDDLSNLDANELADELNYSRDQFREKMEKSGEVKGLEVKIQRKDGSVIFIRENAKAIKGPDDSVTYYEGSFEDITERKISEEAQRESEEKFHTLFESSRDAIGFTGINGDMLDANQSFLEMLGYSSDEIKKRTFQDLTPKKWEDMEKEIVENQVLKEGYSEVYEKEYIRKDGTVIPIEIRLGLLKDETGNPDQMFRVVRDISERKKIEEKLSKQTQELDDRVKELNCLYGVSKATEDQWKPLDKVFQEILSLIPPAWQYPDITTARIIYDGKEYTTDSFQDSPWKLTAEIIVLGKKHGIIEVYFTQEKIGKYEGPFLQEECKLIDILTSHIGEFIERRETEDRLDFEHKNFRRILDSMEDGVYIVNAQYDIEFVNSALKDEFGLVDGKKCYKYLHDRNEPCTWCQIDKVLTGETVRWEWFSSKNQRTYDLIDTPLQNFDGSLSKLEIFRDISSRKKMEEKIRENEEKFRSIFTHVFDALIITDKTGRIVDANTATCNLLGYERDEFSQLYLRDIHTEKDFKKMLALIERVLKGSATQLGEITFLTKDNNRIITEGGGATIDISGERFFVGSFRDITERIRWEEELKNRLMKFNIEDGNLYLIKERTPALSLNVFDDLLKVGYSGHAISRTPAIEFNKGLEKEIDYLWLAENNKKESESSLFKEIEKVLEDKPRKNVILIDRLDYLIANYGFKETIKFVYKMRETAYLKSIVILLSIDPTTIDGQKLSLLEKETMEITPRFMAKVPEEMLEILRFVYKMNNLGTKPSYSEVREELQVSRPTVSKRIKHLVATGYLNETLMGNRKILELSQKGRLLFTL